MRNSSILAWHVYFDTTEGRTPEEAARNFWEANGPAHFYTFDAAEAWRHYRANAPQCEMEPQRVETFAGHVYAATGIYIECAETYDDGPNAAREAFADGGELQAYCVAGERADNYGGIVADHFGGAVFFGIAAGLMDSDICAELHDNLAPCDNQLFFDKYSAAHAAKFGEPFAPWAGLPY